MLARRLNDGRTAQEDAAAQAAEWAAGMSPSEDDSDGGGGGGDDLAAAPREAGAVADLLQRRSERLALLRDLYRAQFSRLARTLRSRHAAYLVDRTKVRRECVCVFLFYFII